MYDDVVRVPLILRPPAGYRSGETCDAFIANAVDLAATFCGMAGAAVPETFQGRSLVPFFRDGGDDPAPRSDIFSAYHGNQFGLYSQRMVRDRRWKYGWNAVAEDELYDLDNDPGELVNRAFDPTAAGELTRLRRRAIEWMEETGDRLVNPWNRAQLEEGRVAGPTAGG